MALHMEGDQARSYAIGGALDLDFVNLFRSCGCSAAGAADAGYGEPVLPG